MTAAYRLPVSLAGRVAPPFCVVGVVLGKRVLVPPEQVLGENRPAVFQSMGAFQTDDEEEEAAGAEQQLGAGERGLLRRRFAAEH